MFQLRSVLQTRKGRSAAGINGFPLVHQLTDDITGVLESNLSVRQVNADVVFDHLAVLDELECVERHLPPFSNALGITHDQKLCCSIPNRSAAILQTRSQMTHVAVSARQAI